MSALRFVIPLPPNRGNARGGWWKHHRAKRAYWTSLDAYSLLGEYLGFEIPRPPADPLTKAKAHATLYVWNLYDDDGAMSLLKWPTDWLVTRGYLEDDKRSVLKWAGLPEQVIDRKRPRVELTLEGAA